MPFAKAAFFQLINNMGKKILNIIIPFLIISAFLTLIYLNNFLEINILNVWNSFEIVAADPAYSIWGSRDPILKTQPTYSEVVALANTIELPDDYFDRMTYLERERAKDIENLLRIGASTDDEFIESKMFFRMKKAYEILEPKTEYEIFREDMEKRAMRGIKPASEYEINKTNRITIKGKEYDVSDWDRNQVMQFLQPLDANESNELYYTERVQSLFHRATPTVKLYYPEPYIAAPSRIHNDIWIVHIIYYQFWLWFFFIFLVVMFFIVFITAVRWGSNQNRPRRETRGVSRSKCGDLITACVPVSWAGSIIVSESADATDITDGFSTNELVVGVRAYQWGWEYYYPKTIDLNYNVRPTYSHMIGNSVKYSTVSNVANESSHFWKHYQKRSLDSAVTPAYLLVLPFDNTNVAQFMNFKDSGVNTLKQSAAFAKIRANSKLFTTNVVTNADQFALKYAKISEYAFNDNNFNESTNYGSVRQHTLTSTQATQNVLSTFLNEAEMGDYFTNLPRKSLAKSNSSNSTNNFTTLLSNESSSIFKQQVENAHRSSTQLQLLNDSSDTKKINYLINLLISKKYNRLTLLDNPRLLTVQNNLPLNKIKPLVVTDILNKNSSNLATLLRSDNTTILPADQLTRNYDKSLSLGVSHHNLSAANNRLNSNLTLNNSISAYRNSFANVNTDVQFLFDKNLATKLWSRRSSFGYPHPLTFSNNPLVDVSNYDTNYQLQNKLKFTGNKVRLSTNKLSTQSNPIMHGEQTNAISGLAVAYWRMFWANTDYQNRVESVFKNLHQENGFYLPIFTNYYDYDFRNAQAIELLDDAFWEVAGSSYNFYDYMSFSKDFGNQQNLLSNETTFNQNYFSNNEGLDQSTRLLLSPVYKDVSILGQFYINSIENDDFFTQANLTLLKDFFVHPTSDMFSTVDDLALTYKTLQATLRTSLTNPTGLSIFTTLPTSYLSVFNNFRSDFEDFGVLNADDLNQPLFNTISDGTSMLKNLNLSNTLTLRSNAKNSVVTYNALKKVFRARFDEGRSHTSLGAFSQLSVAQPFISDKSINYSQLLSKDTSSFYQNFFYKNVNHKIWNSALPTLSTQNFYFYDIPFLMSEGSDPQKFMWFDWWAQWGMYEVQPSSVAKYSTLGVPYSRKHFDFGAGQTDTLNEVETYFIRLSRLRKNYLSNWLYSPFLFNRLTSLSPLSVATGSDMMNLKSTLYDMRWYHTTLVYSNQSVFKFIPSISGYNLYNKSSWRPFTGIQDYFYRNSHLLDILTKREFLYRKYLQTTRRVINLPKSLTANINNTLIDEIKSSYLLSDPISYSTEASREFFYSSLPFFKFLIFKSLVADLLTTTKNLPFNFSAVNEYLFFYALNTNSLKVGLTDTLYKDQHRPLKKSITNMLRLHGTGAIAMPVDVRLQILASSRDVIHSWAIPSAGIKIDCVPGYTSHRIMTFSLTGIYWGQCMEICGRYHHWMPIIIYFMKRDLFFLWCTHFVFKTSKLPNLKTTDKQYMDYLRLVSYDKSTWLNELSRQR